MIQFRNDNRNTPNLFGSKLIMNWIMKIVYTCLFLPSFEKWRAETQAPPIFCALEKRESLECEISSGSFRFDEVCWN